MSDELDDEDFSRGEKRTRKLYGLGYRLGSWVGERENKRYKKFAKEHGIEIKPSEPLKRTKSDYVFFGSFPQTIMSANVTIQTQLSEYVYLGSDGEKYFRKFYKKEQSSCYGFDVYTHYSDEIVRYSNLKKPNSDEGNYFKIEPIKWRVINRENGVLTLLSEHSLFYDMFKDIRNTFGKSFFTGSDWSSSDVRSVLNGDFLDFAFGDDKEKILLTDVHNETKHLSIKEKLGSVDTRDKVYLLSEEEGKRYGLNSVDLSKHQTDFCGPYYDCIGEKPRICYDGWLTRTPCYYYSDYIKREGGTVMIASGSGFKTTDSPSSKGGVVPVIRVMEEDVKVYSPPPPETTDTSETDDASAQSDGVAASNKVEKQPPKLNTVRRVIYSILTPLLAFLGALLGVVFTGSGGPGNIMTLVILAYLIFTEIMIWKTKNISLVWFLMFMMVVVGAVCFSIGNATKLW